MLIKKYLHIVCSFVALSCSQLAHAQVDLFAEKDEPIRDIVTSTFKTTRIINGQSIENVGKGVLDFRILHRFGPLSDGGYNFFGLDQASMRLGLDYGISRTLMVGVGRSTFDKQYDGFVKWRILSQTTGGINFPFALSYAGTMIYKSLKNPTGLSYTPYETDRFTYAHQLILARKFNDAFSMQLTPTMVHYNLVANNTLPNDFYSLGIGVRQRISKRVNITSEYFYRYNKLDGYHNSFSVGFDIETCLLYTSDAADE